LTDSMPKFYTSDNEWYVVTFFIKKERSMSLLELSKRHVQATIIAACLCSSMYGLDWLLPSQQISQLIPGITPDTFVGVSNEPIIVSDGADNVVAVWVQNGSVYGAGFDVVTKKWNAPDLIWDHTPDVNYAYNPKAVIIGSNKAIVTWKVGNPATTFTMTGTLYTPGTSLPTINTLSTANASSFLDEYSLVKYGTGSALVTYPTAPTGTPATNAINSAVYTPNTGTFPLTFTNISANGPASFAGTDNTKFAPFVAIDPTTNIPYVVYTQLNVTTANNDSVIGAPIIVSGTTVTAPVAGNFTIFAPKAINASNSFPQIYFNPANNKPVVIWAKEVSVGVGQIVGSAWNTPYPTTLQTLTNSNIISTMPLVETSDLRFSVAVDGPNLFKIVYRQNDTTSTTPVNNVFAAWFVPGVDTTSNIKVSTLPSGGTGLFPQSNITDVPQVACITCPGGQITNVIMWEQNNEVWGATLAFGQTAIADPVKLSTDSNGNVVRDIRFSGGVVWGVALGMALSYGKPVVLWNQGEYEEGDSDEAETFFVFGTSAVQLQPETVTLSQEVHRFPRCSDLVNNITWTPAPGASSYQIYLSTDLDNPLATVTGTQYKHYCRKPCISDTYYLYAVSCSGAKSIPVTLTSTTF
jgi:hypothetical protein